MRLVIEGKDLGELPEGDAGTAATLIAMIELVKSARGDLGIINAARDIADGPDAMENVGRLFNWFKAHVHFRADADGRETLERPQTLLAAIQRNGSVSIDCDSATTLACAMIEAMGYDPVIVVVGRGDRYEHVYSGVKVLYGYIAFDPQEFGAPGVEVGSPSRKLVVSIQ